MSLAVGDDGVDLPAAPVEHLRDDRLGYNSVQILLKRDDLIHPEVSGTSGGTGNAPLGPG
jgi:hypothetical protein